MVPCLVAVFLPLLSNPAIPYCFLVNLLLSNACMVEIPLGVLVSGLILLTLMNSTSHLVFGHTHLLCHLTNVLIQSEIVRRWRQIYR